MTTTSKKQTAERIAKEQAQATLNAWNAKCEAEYLQRQEKRLARTTVRQAGTSTEDKKYFETMAMLRSSRLDTIAEHGLHGTKPDLEQYKVREKNFYGDFTGREVSDLHGQYKRKDAQGKRIAIENLMPDDIHHRLNATAAELACGKAFAAYRKEQRKFLKRWKAGIALCKTPNIIKGLDGINRARTQRLATQVARILAKLRIKGKLAEKHARYTPIDYKAKCDAMPTGYTAPTSKRGLQRAEIARQKALLLKE